MNELNNDINDRLLRMTLSDLRKSSHLSQQELADKSGLSLSTISAIENDNDRSPTLSSIIKYITALGYKISLTKDIIPIIPIKIKRGK